MSQYRLQLSYLFTKKLNIINSLVADGMFPDPDFPQVARILAIREHLRHILRFSYLHGFSGLLGQKMVIFRSKIGKGRGDIDPQRTRSYFLGLHLCVQFGENRQRNATVRVTTHGHTDRRKPILLYVPWYML